jgi:predicted YcjX-like family ATPase
MMQIVYRNIRFSAKVDRCLRRRWRMHGDLSIRVREALDGVNLLDVELLDVDYFSWSLSIDEIEQVTGAGIAKLLLE